MSDLFRKLVEAGVPDDEAVLFDQRGRLALTWRSFHAAAKLMVREAPTDAIFSARYSAPPSKR